MTIYRPAEKLRQAATVHANTRERLKRAFAECADDDQLLTDMLEGESDFGEIIAAALLEAEQRKAMGDGLKAVIEAMQERQKRHYAAHATIRQAVLEAMQEAGETAVKHPAVTVSIRDGKPKLEIPDADAVPTDYCQSITKWVPDKEKIAAELDKGIKLNWAKMADAKPIMTVRIK